jgi:hypothetical protein
LFGISPVNIFPPLLALQFRILEVPGANIGPEKENSDSIVVVLAHSRTMLKMHLKVGHDILFSGLFLVIDLRIIRW